MPNYLPQQVYDDLAARRPWNNDTNPFLPTGSIAQTMSRLDTTVNGTALLSGREDLVLVWLNQGQRVASITHYSATTAGATLTNQWFSLRNSSRVLLAITADDLTTAWAANTAKTLTLTAPYVVRASGFYYVGRMVAATTVPTLQSATGHTTINTIPPIVSGTADTGLTTPATAPATSAALTPTAVIPYVTLA